MSVHKYTSWGRTRGPKNLSGSLGDAGGKVTVLEDTSTLVGIGATTAGHATENQRYMHVLIEDATTSDDPAVTTIYGYCHAFQRWFEIPQSAAAGEGPNTAPTAASIDIGNISGRAAAAQVPSDREYRRYEIAGIDRVAFVNGTPAEVNVFAACCTF